MKRFALLIVTLCVLSLDSAGANEIMATLQLARSYASSQREPHSVRFDLEKEEFWITRGEIEAKEEMVGKVERTPYGINIIRTDFVNDKITECNVNQTWFQEAK